MKQRLRILLALACVSSWGTPVVLGSEAKLDPKLKVLTKEYERLKLQQLVQLNKTYIAKIEGRLKKAMREGDLPAANQADRVMKRLITENTALERRQKSAELIASLAGEWELATTRWGFKIFPDGRVTPTKAEGDREGRIFVIDLEKKMVRMTGFPTTMTWEVTAGSESLHGTQHPAIRKPSRKSERK